MEQLIKKIEDKPSRIPICTQKLSIIPRMPLRNIDIINSDNCIKEKISDVKKIVNPTIKATQKILRRSIRQKKTTVPYVIPKKNILTKQKSNVDIKKPYKNNPQDITNKPKKARLNFTQNTFMTSSDKIKYLEAENVKLNSSLKDYQNRITKFESQIEEHSSHVSKYKTAYEKESDQAKQLLVTYNKCKTDLDDLNKVKSELDHLNKTLADENVKYKLENETLQLQLRETQKSLAQTVLLHEQVEAKLSKLQNEYESVLQNYAGLQSRNLSLIQRNKWLCQALYQAEIKRRNLHNQIMDLKGNIRVFCRVRPLLPHELIESNNFTNKVGSNMDALKQQQQQSCINVPTVPGSDSVLDNTIIEICKWQEHVMTSNICRQSLKPSGNSHTDLGFLAANNTHFSRASINPTLGQSMDDSCIGKLNNTNNYVPTVLHKFKFDHVFGPETTQSDVYSEVSGLIQSALDGYNVCIFAYGATGSGKTYTMEGGLTHSKISSNLKNTNTNKNGDYFDEDTAINNSNEMVDTNNNNNQYSLSQQMGLIPRAFQHIFSHLAKLENLMNTSTLDAEERQILSSSKTSLMQNGEMSKDDFYGKSDFNEHEQHHANGEKMRNVRFELTANFIEIYNDKIRDLLFETKGGAGGEQPDFKIKMGDGEDNIISPDVTKIRITEWSQVLHLLKRAHKNRAVAETKLNQSSSRSHSVFQLKIDKFQESINYGSNNKVSCSDYQFVSSSILSLVDLAGSERIKQSGSTHGDRLAEAKHINSSLSALSTVITCLAKKAKHIPYRNSKLTHLLKSSLGCGNSKTLMFVNVSPLESRMEETVTSLRFASNVNACNIGVATVNNNKQS